MRAFAFTLAVLLACHSQTGSTLVQAGETCASDKFGTQVTTLGGLVVTVLGAVADVAGSANWEAEMLNLVKQVGSDLVDCAAKAVIAAIKGGDSPAAAHLTQWLNRKS